MDISIIKKLADLKDWLENSVYGKRHDLRSIAKRVIAIFNAHGIPVSRIPLIFPEYEFKLKDFDNLDTIVAVLSPQFLDAISTRFFINREWLDHGQGATQPVFESGYDFGALYDLLVSFDKDNTDDSFIVYFVIEEGVKFKPAEDYGTYDNVIIILEHITEIVGSSDAFTFSRYQPLYFGYWHYYKTRMMIKSLSLLLFQTTTVMPQKGLFHKKFNEENILTNRFSAQILNEKSSDLWHPDDYIFCNGKSAQEKDPHDAERMQTYLKDLKLFDKIKNLSASQFIE